MSVQQVSRDEFIERLDLPAGIVPKHFEGMNRYHFKYYGDGFVVLDLKKNYYHLRAKEEYLRDVGVFDYALDKNHPSKPATIKEIPYDDTDVFYRLVNYITHDKVYMPIEQSSINIPIKPTKTINNENGSIQYICGRCKTIFEKSPRCPECGQLVDE